MLPKSRGIPVASRLVPAAGGPMRSARGVVAMQGCDGLHGDPIGGWQWGKLEQQGDSGDGHHAATKPRKPPATGPESAAGGGGDESGRPGRHPQTPGCRHARCRGFRLGSAPRRRQRAGAGI